MKGEWINNFHSLVTSRQVHCYLRFLCGVCHYEILFNTSLKVRQAWYTKSKLFSRLHHMAKYPSVLLTPHCKLVHSWQKVIFRYPEHSYSSAVSIKTPVYILISIHWIIYYASEASPVHGAGFVTPLKVQWERQSDDELRDLLQIM